MNNIDYRLGSVRVRLLVLGLLLIAPFLVYATSSVAHAAGNTAHHQAHAARSSWSTDCVNANGYQGAHCYAWYEWGGQVGGVYLDGISTSMVALPVTCAGCLANPTAVFNELWLVGWDTLDNTDDAWVEVGLTSGASRGIPQYEDATIQWADMRPSYTYRASALLHPLPLYEQGATLRLQISRWNGDPNCPQGSNKNFCISVATSNGILYGNSDNNVMDGWAMAIGSEVAGPGGTPANPYVPLTAYTNNSYMLASNGVWNFQNTKPVYYHTPTLPTGCMENVTILPAETTTGFGGMYSSHVGPTGC